MALVFRVHPIRCMVERGTRDDEQEGTQRPDETELPLRRFRGIRPLSGLARWTALFYPGAPLHHVLAGGGALRVSS